MLVFFLIITVGIQNRILAAQQERNEAIAIQLASLINNEAVLASSVHDGYNRTFYLPAIIDGSNYSVSLYNRQDLIVDYRGRSYLYFLDVNSTITPLQPGLNFISNY